MFSIVIPAYNAEKNIKTSIQSVLNQTRQDFEIIVVDDGSTDGTKGNIEQYEDNKIIYIYQENAGVSAARNRGIQESNGEFVCFLDADDEWKSNHLEVLQSLIEKYGHCGLFITGYDIRLNTGEIVRKSEHILRGIAEEHFVSDNGFDVLMKNGYFFNTNTMCCRREVFDKVGGFEIGVKNGEDDDMWFRIFTYYPIAVSKISTTIYNRTNCGATGKRPEVAEPFFMRRLDGILKSDQVPQCRKESLLLWSEQNKLSRARQFVLNGSKREAITILKKLDLKKTKKKRYLQTLLCCFIPSAIIRRYIDKRDIGYYN